MKIKIFSVLLVLTLILFAGCNTDDDDNINEVDETNETVETDDVDVVTTASIVNTAEGVLKAAGPDVYWLFAITEDVTVNEDIVLEGEYTVPDKADPALLVPAGRKVALYAQDADRNKTASYTLTAPTLIVKSTNSKIQGGTFKGDVEVQATGFNLVDQKIDGNVYFATQELMDAFTMDDKSSVTGVTEVK